MKKKTLVLLLACSLSITSLSYSQNIPAVSAAVQTQTPFNKILKTINLSSVSYMTLKDPILYSQDGTKLFVFKVSVYNGGNTELDMLDYWVRIQTKAGVKYPVKSLNDDKKNNRVAPKTTKEYNYYAEVSDELSLSSLILSVKKFDINSPGLEKTIGSATIQSNFTSAVPVGRYKQISLGNTPLILSIPRASLMVGKSQAAINLDLNIINKGSSTFTDPKFKVYLKTPQGTIYPLQVDPADSNYKIYGNQTKKLFVYGTIPASLKDKAIEVLIGTEDETTKKTIMYNAFQIPIVKNNIGKSQITIQGEPVSVTLVKKTMTNNSINSTAILSVAFENMGKKSIKLPVLTGDLMTNTGEVYGMTGAPETEIVLKPRTKKTITLSGRTETNNVEKLDVIIRPAIKEGTDVNPDSAILLYTIDKTESGVGSGNETPNGQLSFTTGQGNYEGKLESIRKIPWKDYDVITSTIKVSNNTDSPMPLPNLSAYYSLDGVKIEGESVQVIPRTTLLTIPSKQSVEYVVLAKVSYNNEFKNINVVLTEKNNDTIYDLVSFTADSQQNVVPELENGQNYKITTDGNTSEYDVKRTGLYVGDNSGILMTELEAKNDSQRHALLPGLAGYYLTKDGMMYPVIVMNLTDKISPSGKGLITLYSMVPKNLSTDNLSLVMGAAVKAAGGNNTAIEGAFVQAVSIKNLQINTTPQDSTSNIAIGAYNLSLSSMLAQFSYSGMTFDFNYNLSANDAYEGTKEERSIQMEFVDGNFGSSIVKELPLLSGENALKLGQNEITLDIPDDKMSLKIKNYPKVTFNVYEIIKYKEGEKTITAKRIVATRQLEWFKEVN
ncbi:hypothetical protein [Cohnella silvisoli]|uniref:DUF916 domain-containing protein n=1 Tax=Cohnella silvisoli TaxID=2873699 RepID=A0ABV1KPU8_9BACL|nr:hypothetical protein [Cohnella silvisoli]MCD9022285.1 hypothetical protein [Cohnella silvisoli]